MVMRMIKWSTIVPVYTPIYHSIIYESDSVTGKIRADGKKAIISERVTGRQQHSHACSIKYPDRDRSVVVVAF